MITICQGIAICIGHMLLQDIYGSHVAFFGLLQLHGMLPQMKLNIKNQNDYVYKPRIINNHMFLFMHIVCIFHIEIFVAFIFIVS